MKIVSNFWNKYSGPGILLIMPQTRDENTLRGRPFDSEGAGLVLLVGEDYLFSSPARPENLFPGKPRTEYLFSTQQIFEKAKKKKKRGGGGLVRGFSRGDRTWFSTST